MFLINFQGNISSGVTAPFEYSLFKNFSRGMMWGSSGENTQNTENTQNSNPNPPIQVNTQNNSIS